MLFLTVGQLCRGLLPGFPMANPGFPRLISTAAVQSAPKNKIPMLYGRFSARGPQTADRKAHPMATVTLSNNTIAIPRPHILNYAINAAGAVVIFWILFSLKQDLQSAAMYLRDVPSGDSGIRINSETIRSDIAPRAAFVLAAIAAFVFAARRGLAALFLIGSWIKEKGFDNYANAPGPLDGAIKSVGALFNERRMTQDLPEKPGFVARSIFGDIAYWIAPSSGALLTLFDKAFWRIFKLTLIVVVPTFLQAGWLTELLDRFDLPQDRISTVQSIEESLRWPLHWSFLAVSIALIASLGLAIRISRGKQCQVAVMEVVTRVVECEDPDTFYNAVARDLKALRHLTFPNRIITKQAPGIGRVRDGDRGSFKCWHTLETQPVPVAGGRNLASIYVCLIGCLLSVTGYWILLVDMRIASTPLTLAAWWPPLATVSLALWGGRNLSAVARMIMHTYRFSSDLIHFEANGTFRISKFGAGDGRGGGVFNEVIAVHSTADVNVLASRIITECSAPESSWHPTAEAMQSPRRIIDTMAQTDFAERIDAIIEHVEQEKRVSAPKLDLSANSGFGEIVAVNRQLDLERIDRQTATRLIQNTPPLRLPGDPPVTQSGDPSATANEE